MRHLLTLTSCLSLVACVSQEPIESDWVWEAARSLSPLEGPPDDPTNRLYEDPAAALFGEKLFFDTRLSSNKTVSCSSCHIPLHAFADSQVLSTGVDTSQRHTPSLLNVAWDRWFFWDGHADTLWSQALKPLEGPTEHGFSRLALAHLISEEEDLSTEYTALFGALPELSDQNRFPESGRPIDDDPENPDHLAWIGMTQTDQQTINEIFVNIGKTIAAFERGLIQTNSPFDNYIEAKSNGYPNAEDDFGSENLNGLELFVGSAGCINCHSGPTFSDLQFHNVGLSTAGWMDSTDVGRSGGIPKLLADPFNGAGEWSDDPETGLEKLKYINENEDRLAQFKTPSLRNVELSPPYMHSGQLATLEEVVSFYNNANLNPSVGHREEIILPLNLSLQEQAYLVSFLRSLTGENP